MQISLVGPDLEENLSIRYLSASLTAAGHTTRIVPFDTSKDQARVLERSQGAEIAALSMCYQVRAAEFLALAKALKQAQPSRPIVAGGHFASCAAVELLEHHPEIDVIVLHEGERAIVELAALGALVPETLARVQGIAYRDESGRVVRTSPREILADLDTLAWPDRAGPSRLLSGVPTAYMMGSRGCVSACDYCCITTLHRMAPGKRFRQRRPEAIADEMAWLYHERGVRQFVFHDDNFLVPSVPHNLERIDALGRAIRSRGLRHIGLVLKCRPADVNEVVFLRLREMGLLRVFLGIESGTTEGLASIGRHQTVSEEHGALEVCEKLDISTQYTIIIFHPEATPETMLSDLRFVRAHLGHPMNYCRAEIYAGTPLEKRMLATLRTRGTYIARTYQYTDPRTENAWEMGKMILSARCWTQDNILGQVIRLDHQAAVFRHFYDGREVDALVSEFLALEHEINADTVQLLEDWFAICRDIPDAQAPELLARRAELAQRERIVREDFQNRICRIRQEIQRRSLGAVGIPAPREGAGDSGRSFGSRPRHATAALLAAGLLGCGASDQPEPVTDAGGDGNRYVIDGGVMEAAPPPVDSGTSSRDTASDQQTTSDATFVIEGGVSEAAPPPWWDAAVYTPADSGPDGGDASVAAGDAGHPKDSGTPTDSGEG
jgi:radical SAM superfamily enzyme YgiQ (UPF0313 family)